jgi:hypothetical protein
VKCKHKRADGRPCGAPEALVNEDGECPAHRPGGSEAMSAAGRKGAAATKRRWRRDMTLPPLTTFQAAQKWLEITGRAVAAGHLGAREADAITRTAQAWINAAGGAELEDLVRQLRGRVKTLERRLAQAEGRRTNG